MTTAEPTQTEGLTTDEISERIFAAVLGAFDVFSIYLGDRLGYYRSLADGRPVTPAQLAHATETDERYAREWLEQQAVTGFLLVDDIAGMQDERRYRLPASHAEVLTNRDSLNYLAPVAVQTTAAGLQLPTVADAFRSGEGVPWDAYGDDMRGSQGEMNRPLFLQVLGPEWLASTPDLHERLSRPGARVADIGCGLGWSSIGIATAYPDVRVDGYDVDAPAVEEARRHAEEHGVADRVRFELADAAGVEGEPHDLVIALECVHDMPDPVSVLRAMRGMAADDGHVLVVDARTEDAFTAPGSEMERLFYGFSVTTCLPDGRSHEQSVGTGTVMRADTLR